MLEWYNLVFLAPIILGVLYLLSMAMGIGHLDHDIDADHDVEFHDPGGLSKALSLLGVGKVPASIIVVALCFTFGVIGLASNAMLGGLIPAKNLLGLASVAIAIPSSVFLTRIVSRALSKVIPSVETYVTTKEDLIGGRGKALYEIAHDEGTVRIFDPQGNLQTVKARTSAPGVRIPAGTEVLLTEYVVTGGYFVASAKALKELDEL